MTESKRDVMTEGGVVGVLRRKLLGRELLEDVEDVELRRKNRCQLLSATKSTCSPISSKSNKAGSISLSSRFWQNDTK